MWFLCSGQGRGKHLEHRVTNSEVSGAWQLIEAPGIAGGWSPEKPKTVSCSSLELMMSSKDVDPALSDLQHRLEIELLCETAPFCNVGS